MTSPLLLATVTLVFTLDLIGTFVFALSGAASGVKNKLDPSRYLSPAFGGEGFAWRRRIPSPTRPRQTGRIIVNNILNRVRAATACGRSIW